MKKLRNYLLLASISLAIFILTGRIWYWISPGEETPLVKTVRLVVSVVLGLILTVYFGPNLIKRVERLHLVKKVDAETKELRSHFSTWWTIDLLFALVALTLLTATKNWLDPRFLLFATVSILMFVSYFILIELTEIDVLFTSGETETFALVVNNGALVRTIMFSEKFRPSEEDGKWDFVKGKEPKSVLEEEMNARWFGWPWNRQFHPVRLRCHRWKEDVDGKRIKAGTEEKPNHYFEKYIPLYHTHAYVTDEIEVPGMIHVIGAFNFRFRITNPHKAFFMTTDVVNMLNTIVRGVTRQIWATTEYENIRVSKFETDEEDEEDGPSKSQQAETSQDGNLIMGYALMNLMNAELKKYGIKIIDIHLVDVINTREEEVKALRARKLAELHGLAQIEAANKDKEVKLINANATAAANLIIANNDAQTTLIRAEATAKSERKIGGAFYRAHRGDPRAMMAFAVRNSPNLRVLGGNASMLLDGEGEVKPKPTKDK
jgi:uncharacterized membrane protein